MRDKNFDQVREGEKPRTWYRSERVYRNERGWYFSTREGIDVGPFGCRFDAEVDLEALIERICRVDNASVLQAIHRHAVSAGTSTEGYQLNSLAYTNYLVEEGGVELLQAANIR